MKNKLIASIITALGLVAIYALIHVITEYPLVKTIFVIVFLVLMVISMFNSAMDVLNRLNRRRGDDNDSIQ